LALFEQQILDIRRFVKDRQAEGREVREMQCPRSPEKLLKDLPVRFDADNAPFVILQEDTFLELGNPLQGSVSMVLWTPRAERVRDGFVTGVGPDMPDASGRSLPFGQIILVGGDEIGEEALPTVERAQHLSHQLEGYMIRRMPGKLWSRVSKEAARKGFNFEILARCLMARYREQIPLLASIEILFVTSSKGDVALLDDISREARDISLSIKKLHRTKDGQYECEDLDCDVCTDKAACDTIRDIIVIREKGRITAIKVVRDQAQAS
jgi:CO dehydrogenase/acetyl-CoA synthase beta subunit